MLALMISLFVSPAIAQEGDKTPGQDGRSERFERIQAMKVAYITQELKLTPEEAEKFWPLYNEFEAKRNQILNGVMKGPPHEKPDFDAMSDEEINEMIQNKFEEERAMVGLQEEYYAKYKEILPVRKVAKYYEAEKRFRSRLLQGLRDGHFKGQREEMRKGRDN
jgi:hypothetical protein